MRNTRVACSGLEPPTHPPRRPRVVMASLLALLAALTAAGCSRGPAMGDVRGTVTLDGQPLPEGVVRFIPVDGATATAGGTIRDGQFIAKVPVATHRVEISANVIDRQLTPPNPTDEQIVMKQLIPERYNTRSELTLRVVAGSNEPRFDLQSRSTGKE